MDVLVVGGGLAGQAAAAFVAAHGLTCTLVSRAPAVRPTSRSQLLSPAAIGALDVLGLGDIVRAEGVDPSKMGDTIEVATLDGPELDRRPQPPAEPGAMCFSHARLTSLVEQASGAEIRRGLEVLDLDGRLSDGTSVDASYIVGADGTDSFVRRSAAIPTTGPGELARQAGVLFRARLRHDFAAARINAVGGMLLPEDDPDTWLLLHDGRSPDPVRAAVGDVDVTVLGSFELPVISMAAQRSRAGRVLLVGDAARTDPPAPGLDRGRIVTDAHDLARRLAAVVRGEATPEHLDRTDG
ncbi:FAD-dependent monooxygenase [Pseudonocardia sp. TRM90224]|uniref:FAD-dependent monooxygenase n=1 Tax=Pseudonocardia sp. TRM90224 TaxID=2812678 RepID=UPI001E54657A|nr:FAD-dependent monooxygenase [Pseudonocardia sp. TRM90224]